MSLQTILDEYKANFEKTAPAEVLERMHRATDDLRDSGILQGVSKIGDQAPHFELQDAMGETVGSKEILTQNYMVLTFYRGRW